MSAPRFGVPWAFLIALGLLVAAEAAVRLVLFPRGVPYHPGRREYLYTRDQLARNGAAEISFIGSSRTREAVSLPLLKDLLPTRQKMTVASYAMPGATAVENEWVTRKILASPHKPRILLYGLSPRQLLGTNAPAHAGRAPNLWGPRDWWGVFRQHGLDALPRLPSVVRNELKQYWWTFACRDTLMQVARRLTGKPPYPSPVLGQNTPTHLLQPHYSLAKHPVTEADVRDYVRKTMGIRRYQCPTRIAQVAEVAELCRQAGVRLVLFEIPMSDILRRNLPDDTYRKFRDTMASIQKAQGVPFYSLEQLGFSPRDEYFMEQSHLNLVGAEQFTRALAETVITPLLEADRTPKQ